MKYQLVYSHSNTLTSKVIQRVTWGTSSHVAVVHKGISYEALIGEGVVRRTAGMMFEELDAYAIYEMDASIRVRDFLEMQVGKPYDYDGISGILFKRDWQNPDKWFCSELAAAAFAFDARPLLRVPPQGASRFGRITPTMLEMSPLPQLIAQVD